MKTYEFTYEATTENGTATGLFHFDYQSIDAMPLNFMAVQQQKISQFKDSEKAEDPSEVFKDNILYRVSRFSYKIVKVIVVRVATGKYKIYEIINGQLCPFMCLFSKTKIVLYYDIKDAEAALNDTIQDDQAYACKCKCELECNNCNCNCNCGCADNDKNDTSVNIDTIVKQMAAMKSEYIADRNKVNSLNDAYKQLQDKIDGLEKKLILSEKQISDLEAKLKEKAEVKTETKEVQKGVSNNKRDNVSYSHTTVVYYDSDNYVTTYFSFDDGYETLTFTKTPDGRYLFNGISISKDQYSDMVKVVENSDGELTKRIISSVYDIFYDNRY